MCSGGIRRASAVGSTSDSFTTCASPPESLCSLVGRCQEQVHGTANTLDACHGIGADGARPGGARALQPSAVAAVERRSEGSRALSVGAQRIHRSAWRPPRHAAQGPEQGAIDLDRPIGNYVKGLNPKIAQVTGNQLLSHTAGLLDEAPMHGSNDEAALEKEVRSWTESMFFTEPSSIYSYSNPGFWLAGFLVQSLSAKPYADQMEAAVFKPLGMTRTTFRPLVAMTYPMAAGHDESPQGPKVIRPAANN